MALWEYKVITSGKGGFATPALLEKFLNDLGREEWEIVEFRSAVDNALAFTGLARRPTQRDWTLEDAAAAAAKIEAEKLRAEFSAKFQAATTNGPAAENKSPTFLEETVAPDDGFRKPIDTSRDSEPDTGDEEPAEKDEWDLLGDQDELPSFFEALKPHMRRNQRGPGMSVGTDYLAKKWGLDESDIKGALVECGLQIPADENAKPAYVEYDGDLYWVNINRRGEVWINTREKPRPVFRVVQATKVTPETSEEPKSENPRSEDRGQKSEDRSQRAEGRGQRSDDGGQKGGQKTETVRQREKSGRQPEMPAPASAAPATGGSPEAAAAGSGAALPEGPPLLQTIRPHMRRNRRGPGGSGSASFLARALKTTESELLARFAAIGLVLPAAPKEPPIDVEIGNEIWWLNQDSRGGVWINGRDKRPGDKPRTASQEIAAQGSAADVAEAVPTAEVAPSSSAASAAAVPAAETQAGLALEPATASEGGVADAARTAAPAAESATAERTAPDSANVFPAVRLLLKETRTGSFAGKIERVASELGRSAEELTNVLIAAGLKVPDKPREKPVFVEHAGEIFWFNKNAKDEVWVNAKASKFAGGSERSATAAGDEADKRPRRSVGRGRTRKPEANASAAEAPSTPSPADAE